MVGSKLYNNSGGRSLDRDLFKDFTLEVEHTEQQLSLIVFVEVANVMLSKHILSVQSF